MPKSILISTLLSPAGWFSLQSRSSFSHQRRMCAPSLWANQCWTQRESRNSGTRGITDPSETKRDLPRWTRCESKYFIEYFEDREPPPKFLVEVLLKIHFRSCRWNYYQLICSTISFRTSLESFITPFYILVPGQLLKAPDPLYFLAKGNMFKVFISLAPTHCFISFFFLTNPSTLINMLFPCSFDPDYFSSPLTAKSSLVFRYQVSLSSISVHQSRTFQTQELSSEIATCPEGKLRARILKQEWTNSFEKNAAWRTFKKGQ